MATASSQPAGAGAPAEPAAAQPGAIEALYAAHFGRLVRLATGWLGDRDAAEDVAQEALIAADAALRRGMVIADPGAWLTRVARRRAVSLLRRDRAHGGVPAETLAALLADPADLVVARERLDRVLAALLGLPAASRADLLLSLRVADRATAAAARGVTPAAWQARLVRAREALRLALTAPTGAVARWERLADRRAAVVALQAEGLAPAAIARRLQLPRHIILSDLAAHRRQAPVVALLRQLLLFDEATPSLGTDHPAVIAGGPPRSGLTDPSGRSRPGIRRRSRPRNHPPPAQLALPW